MDAGRRATAQAARRVFIARFITNARICLPANSLACAKALSILGSVTAVLLILSPMVAMHKLLTTKSHGPGANLYIEVPHAFGLLKALAGVMYSAMSPDSRLAFGLVSAIGCSLQGLYIGILLVFGTLSAGAKDYYKTRLFWTSVAIFVVYVSFFVWIVVSEDHGLMEHAFLSVNTFVYGAPLFQLYHDWKHNKFNYLVLVPLGIGLCNAILWSLYSLLLSEVNLLTSNAIGIGLSVFQLVLCRFVYLRSRVQPVVGTEIELDEV